MSEQNFIDVVVDGIHCYWQVMASFGEHGKKELVCARYSYLDSNYNGNKEVEKFVPVPMPSLTESENSAIDMMTEAFGLDEEETAEIRDIALSMKWKNAAYRKLQELATKDKMCEEASKALEGS